MLDQVIEKRPRAFVTKRVNDVMRDAAATPDPKNLYKRLWAEGELACLFAESNVGKSILAVQIAEQIAKQQAVLYVDCEFCEKQFFLRYSNEKTGAEHVFPSEFFRSEYADGVLSDERQRIEDIEEIAISNHANVVIIDNLTAICNDSENGEVAGRFMQMLKYLQKKHGWAIMLLAHTPKRIPNTPLTQNSLAGSKKLINFFDTVMALGKVSSDPSLRYLKVVKYRRGEFNEDDALVLKIDKQEDGHLVFIEQGTSSELDLLQGNGYEDPWAKQVMNLRAQGLSIRQIAERTGISKSSVQRIEKAYSRSIASAVPVETLKPYPFEDSEMVREPNDDEDIPLEIWENEHH